MTDALVIGGGLAGSSAALLLARGGRRVTLIEREAGPHDKVCGEFLSVEAVRDLAALGLDTAALGAVSIDKVRIAAGQRQVSAPLGFRAHGLSRRILDEALLETAARAGARIERGVRVTGIEAGRAETARGGLSARNVLLATGKHDVHGFARSQVSLRPAPADHIGFKMHWRVSPAVAAKVGSAVELVLFEGGYAGLQRVAGDVINLCLVIRRNAFRQLGANWQALLARLEREPFITSRLADAEPLFARPLAIANLPYGFLCRPDAGCAQGIYRLGDQAAMTASLTGDGMAIALRSARLAVRAIEAGEPAEAYHAYIAAHAGGQVRRAMAIQRASRHAVPVSAALALARWLPGLIPALAGATRLPALAA